MSATIDEAVEILAAYESWKEAQFFITEPDVSLTAYIRVLEAGQPDPRIAEIHRIAVIAVDEMNEAGPNRIKNYDDLLHISKITDTVLDLAVENKLFPY